MADEHAVTVVPVQTMSDAYRVCHASPRRSRAGKAWTHFGLGGAMVAAVTMAGRLLWVGWPFHPIGLLLMNAWPLQVFWFSILTGWAMKQLLLHYGGAILFRRDARAFFIGLIIGRNARFFRVAGCWGC